MSNTILTPTAVGRAVAAVLHQKGKFLNRINRQFDAQEPDGRKAGGVIKIRMPNQYTVRRSTVMATQEISEVSETLAIASPFGVDWNFTDADLALSLEDFTKRCIEPAVKALVSDIESFFIQDAWNSICNFVDDDGQVISYKDIMKARQKLTENLVPDGDDDISLFLSPTHNTNLIDALKGLFVPGQQLGSQFKSGDMQPLAGVGWLGVSTHLTDFATGTAAKTTTYTVNGASEGTAGLITVQTGSQTFKKGEKFTCVGSNAVHPETKADLGYLKQLVVTTDYAGGAGTVAFSPGIGGATALVASGARQNVTALPTSGGAVVKLGAGVSEKINRSMYFHRDFYAVSFANLENPKKYGEWGDVQEVDGISVRVWRAGDIINGKFPGRMDVLCGGKAIRPQLACGIHADG
jgi:hypothetical protein